MTNVHGFHTMGGSPLKPIMMHHLLLSFSVTLVLLYTYVHFYPTICRYDKIQDIFLNMVDRTGLSMVETDGPYGGAPCEATNHSHHLGQDYIGNYLHIYRNTQGKQLLEVSIYAQSNLDMKHEDA